MLSVIGKSSERSRDCISKARVSRVQLEDVDGVADKNTVDEHSSARETFIISYHTVVLLSRARMY